MDGAPGRRRCLYDCDEVVIDMADDEFSAEELERARRARLIDEARATVERLKDIEKRKEEITSLPPSEFSRRLTSACADDAIERWARDADERERQRRTAERELRREARRDRLIRKRHEGGNQLVAGASGWEGWEAWLDSHFEQERAMVLDVVGEYLGEFIARERKKREEMRDEIRELRVQCARLGSESAELRVQLAQLAVDRSSKVVDLPSPLSSRRVVN